ncbi:MAK10-like protein [Tanacetum coccineum]
MGDKNPICTLRDYSKPSHEGYRNTIELPIGNNVEDLTTRFLAQFFPPGKTAKLQNDILMFQQHHGESLSEAWTRFKDLLQNVPHHGIVRWLQIQIFYDHVSFYLKCEIDRAAGGKLRNKNADESWEIIENLALYHHQGWNDTKEFIKLVKAITLPQDVLSTSDRYLIELENQVQRLMEAHLALMQPTQKTIYEKLDDTTLCDTVRGPTAQMNFTSTNYHTKEELRSKGIKSLSKLLSPKYRSQSSVIERNKNPSSPNVFTSKKEVEEETEGEIKEEEDDDPEHFDTFPTMKELRYHEWLLKNPRPPWVKAKIITENVNNVKFSCMIGQFNKEKAYLDLESPINIMSRLHYNWIMSNRLEPRRKPSNPNKNCNFIGRVKGLRVFVGNFTYECDFMVLEDTTSVIDYYLGSVVFEKPFVEATGLYLTRRSLEDLRMFSLDDSWRMI